MLFAPHMPAERESVAGIVICGTGHEIGAAGASVFRMGASEPVPAARRDGGSALHARVQLSASTLLAQPLRGRALEDSDAANSAGLAPSPRQDVLARTSDGRIVWALTSHEDGSIETLAFDVPELLPEEHLRSRLHPGRFLGALALGHFARACAQRRSRSWSLPQARACIIIDDPNLRGLRYGHLDLPRMVADARRHGYHVTCATVPLDARCADARVADLFTRNPSVISLMVHGIDHVARELAGLRDQDEADAQLAQAYRRIERLESRAGVTVARLVAPPHGVCSEEAARAMLRCGFEAATINRPFPWQAQPPSDRPLAGSLPADLVAGGLPVISRLPFAGEMDDLLLRAWLGMPLVLYGHHADGEREFRRFRAACELVQGLGGAQWMSVRGMRALQRRVAGRGIRIGGATVVSPRFSGRARGHHNPPLHRSPRGRSGEPIEVLAADRSAFVLKPGEACRVPNTRSTATFPPAPSAHRPASTKPGAQQMGFPPKVAESVP